MNIMKHSKALTNINLNPSVNIQGEYITQIIYFIGGEK